jgi:hypothetical protein
MKKYMHFVLIFTIVFSVFLAMVPQSAFAQQRTPDPATADQKVGSRNTPDPATNKPKTPTQKIGIIAPLQVTGIWDLAKKIFETLLTIMLPFVSIALLYSGFLYLKAQGNPAEIAKAHQALIWSLVGTALVLGAWTFSTAIYETIKEILK